MSNTATITIKKLKTQSAPNRSAGAQDATDAWYDYWPDKVSLSVGATYDIEYSTRDYNGKTYKTIQKAATKQASAPANGAGNGRAYEDRGGVPPHVSNWVAHAIQVGLIRSPEQMCEWAQWSIEAGRQMMTPPGHAPAYDADELPEMRN